MKALVMKAKSISDAMWSCVRQPEAESSPRAYLRYRRIKRYAKRVVWAVIIITIWMLVFGKSRLIEDAPIVWRVQYEWTHLIVDILYQVFARSVEGGFAL